MKKSSNVFSQTAIFSATLLVCQLASAQVAQAPEGQKTDVTDPKQTTDQTTLTPATSNSLGTGNLLNTGTGAAQTAFTPGYELSGAKAGDGTAGTMTAPAHGAPIVYGGLYIYLDARATEGRNDNVLGASNNTISSSLFGLEPEVVAEVKNHGDRYTASYLGSYVRYQNSSSDNFNHHDFRVAGDDIFDSRTRLSWNAGYIVSTDPRGSTDRAISSTPDEWHAPTVAGIFSYGATDAIGRVEADASYLNKTYTNNRATTIGSDVDISTVSARFFYRIAPKTSLLIEAKDIKSAYALENSPNSNSDRRLMVGATWVATAATTGIFKIGYLDKSFDQAGITGYKGIAWEGKVRWLPLTYSTFDATVSKLPSDSTGVGDYVMNNNYDLLWTHRWTSQFSSKVDLGYVKSDYVNGNRQDNLKNIGLGVSYDMRRWLRLGAEITNTNRSSTVPGNEFSRNVVLFTLQSTL